MCNNYLEAGGGVEKLEVRVRVRVRNIGENDNKREGGWM